MQADLSGRTAVVTGATRGIGRAIALKLAACGAQVVVHGRDAEAGAQVCEEAARHGPMPIFFAGDILRPEVGRDLMQRCVDEFGRIDILVSSGARLWPRPQLFEETPVDQLPAYFEGRPMSRLFPIHAAVPHMKRQRYGKIVSLTTDAGRVPTPSESLIGASAAALIFFTRAAARELARWGIRLNAISTSLTADTPSHDHYLDAQQSGSDAVIIKAFQKLEARAAFGLNRTQDLAELALYLCAAESDQLSGATVSVNGGASFPSY
jgi:2-hydroxycyclohexanecarboxyl-CoA dehydrogenase